MTDHPSQRFTPQERRTTLAAVMIVFLLSAMDQTIVATAMPRIVAQLRGLDLYPWVTTAYLLASTVMVPIYGRLLDIYGRKPVLLAGVGLFTFGSGLCGLAGAFGGLPGLGGGMLQLIAFRAVQGLGGGALFTSAFAIIADLYPPRERGKFAGLFGSVFGFASVVGPVVGGFLTDLQTIHIFGAAIAGWRWVFYVNLPLALLSLFMILVRMPKLESKRGGRIDWLGAALILTTFVPLLLALSWGGRDQPWTSPRIVGLLAGAAASLLAFVAWELRTPEPILNLKLFRNRTFSIGNGAVFVLAMAFMGLATFLPLYLQLGLGVKATTSGLTLLPLMLGVITGSTLSGLLVTRTGRYKPWMLIGCAMMLAGGVLLLLLGPRSTPVDVAWRVLVLGIGLGPAQSLFTVATQNAVQPSEIGVATSASQFFRQIGSTIGVALFGTVLTTQLASASATSAQHLTLSDLERMAVQAQIAPKTAQSSGPPMAVRNSVAHAIHGVTLAALVVTVIGAAATLMLPELPLRGRGPQARKPEDEAQAAAAAADASGQATGGSASNAGRASA